MACFAEDDMSWQNFRARLGLRADYDSLASNLNIAPRSTFEYLPFSNDTLKFSAGFNRYYGNVFLMTELDEKAYTTYANLSRSASYDSNWDESNNYGWVTTYPLNSQARSSCNGCQKHRIAMKKCLRVSSQIKNFRFKSKMGKPPNLKTA